MDINLDRIPAVVAKKDSDQLTSQIQHLINELPKCKDAQAYNLVLEAVIRLGLYHERQFGVKPKLNVPTEFKPDMPKGELVLVA